MSWPSLMNVLKMYIYIVWNVNIVALKKHMACVTCKSICAIAPSPSFMSLYVIMDMQKMKQIYFPGKLQNKIKSLIQCDSFDQNQVPCNNYWNLQE